MDGIVSFLEMDMAKEICKSKFQQEVGGTQFKSTSSKGG
jgi:hypothetical protein